MVKKVTEPADDPEARAWQRATPVEVPLTGQTLAVPTGGGTIKAVTARALHDGQRLYIQVEWPDATQDTSVVAVEDFDDAVAVQFPANAAEALPFYCMGQADNTVNIRQWKPSWQKDIEAGYQNTQARYPEMKVNLYPFEEEELFSPARAVGNPLSLTERTSPVGNLTAGGFGTLESLVTQDVQGKGVWKDYRWLVVFARDLATEDEGEAQFAVGSTTPAAFAVWDGAKDERDGTKSVSQFINLELSAEEAPALAPLWLPWAITVAVLLLIGLAGGWFLWRRQRRAA